jgi:hypothetical protein
MLTFMNKTTFNLTALNGWQRLWVLLSSLFAFVVVAVVIAEWPQETEFVEARATYTVELVLKAVSMKAQRSGNEIDEFKARHALEEGAAVVRAKNYAYLPASELIAKISPVLADTPFQEELVIREAKDARDISNMRIKSIVSGLLIWFVVIALTYACGWSIEWVRNGFRGNGT